MDPYMAYTYSLLGMKSGRVVAAQSDTLITCLWVLLLLGLKVWESSTESALFFYYTSLATLFTADLDLSFG